jgi:hypothetical protein
VKKPLPYKLYYVEWMDAASNEGWVSPDDDTSPEIIISVGWLIKETEVYITLANSMHKNAAGQVGGTMTIPNGMIINKKEVKLSASRKPRNKVHPEPATKEVHREQGEG